MSLVVIGYLPQNEGLVCAPAIGRYLAVVEDIQSNR